ncbi:hypothetical protein F5B22DRAFT_26153 [Xylaria bambusicola]|uniref:uncharacterized protein n=1 Tax=Xylaria bambusicola TaxID=326684 RepID=UPI00200861D9|nr:uncharacterized protein F5B22DRAFT_26153 [Xylaria bambusicola]KAI0528197.1 hypothetical protein F5B22DRAFT_26153 [Xylaria bambusicola]
MAARATEDELNSAAVAALPTPAGTPYRTPSRTSRKSRRSATPPRVPSSSPPAYSADRIEKKNKRASKEPAVDENFGILDPRRFTPTLHANLVSEILNLRRDQEDKLKIIESLETTLHAVHEEKDAIQANLTETAKESRSLKRQLALLEGGTSSALGELGREREEAVEAAAETKRRLETAQKKVRTQEEDSLRVHALWAKEKDDWEEERRKLERKLHVAETRLKAVIEEVENLQAAQSNVVENGVESEAEENDGNSVRTQSITNSIRFSTISGLGGGKVNGMSLADELNFDDDDDYQTDPDGRQSVLSTAGHGRNMSRDSVASRTHRRNHSIDSQARPGSVARGRLYTNPSVLARLEGDIQEDDELQSPTKSPEYTDAAVQYSPPPSPKIIPSKPSTPEIPVKVDGPFDLESPPRGEMEIEANQRRKRVRINRPGSMVTPKIITHSMVSSASQTAEPLSPPRTPLSPVPTTTDTPAPEPDTESIETKSVATQTESAPEPKPVTPLAIPSISIVPPTSRSPSPHDHRLPQHSKDAGCQVSILQSMSAGYQSASVQTDEIRVDKRLAKLPRHLHPDAITSRPSSPTPNNDTETKPFTPVPGHLPPRNPRRLASKSSFVNESAHSPPVSPSIAESETRDMYPGNNDNGPLSDKVPMRRPPRISSLFAGFDIASSDEADEFGDADFSDQEYRTALSAPRPNGVSSRQSKRTTPSAGSTSPENIRTAARDARSFMKQAGGPEIYSSFSLADSRDVTLRKSSARPPNPSSRASVMRKAAMIQNGISTHKARSPSPSLLEPREPPFPIPTRASSRQPGVTASAPSDGSRSPSHYGHGWYRRGRKGSIYGNNSIRKVRSAAALPRGGGRYRRHASRSPPPMTPSEEAPESPRLPPMPNNDITTPRNRDIAMARYKSSHKSQPSTNTAYTENTTAVSVGSSQHAASVVEAIAQAMVGEWMFKYVRRRKSFGMAEGGGREENSNDRHKRWVWLAPYERAILWSSKQPISGSALMGKSGRKLTIQSVLDVKDDNPIPKGETQIFNRSILILTPQRALKFTAVSAERHYLWIMALSFLAHSQQAVPEITPSLAPPKPAPAPDPELSKLKTKRSGIRDSIRLTKGKNPNLMARHDQIAQPSLQEEPEPVPTFPAHIDHEAFRSMSAHQRELSGDAAEPPLIPRFNGRAPARVHERAGQVVLHGRKRSNTGGHVPPPVSFRGFSSPVGGSSMHASTNSTAGASIDTAGSSSDVYGQSSNMTWGVSTNGSQRTSEASSRPAGNFFEAIGTVRMEAFINPISFGGKFDDHPDETEEMRHRVRRQSKERRRRRSRSRHRDSYSYLARGTRGAGGSYRAGSRAGGEEDFFREDPFRGF